MYKGRQQLGDFVALSVLCRDGNNVPAVPDRAPLARVYSGSTPVLTMRLPLCDKQDATGLFCFRQLLDSRFATGAYSVQYQYAIFGTYYGDADAFEIVAGGNIDGPGVGMAFYGWPSADFVLVQTESGRVIRKRNPRVA